MTRRLSRVRSALGLLRSRLPVDLPVEVVLGPDADFTAPRDRAFTDGTRIVVSRKLEEGPPAELLGVLAHELAHCVYLRAGEEHTERDADLLAERLFGLKISYSVRGLVQTVGPGFRPRPWGLPP